MRSRSVLFCLTVFVLAPAPKGAAQDGGEVVIRSEVRLVEAYASVFDRHGNPLPGLTQEKFEVLDGGQPQPLFAFEGAKDNVRCALLLDVTGSMNSFLPALKSAAAQFVDQLRPDQQVALYTFTTSLRLELPFTADKRAVKQSLLRLTAGGGTALFDAVSNVSRDLESLKGKKALVLFTDGADNASELGASAASHRAQLSGVPIYAIAEGDAIRSHELLKTLDKLADDSGGLVFPLDKPSKIGDVFAAIVHDLNSTYLLQWRMPEKAGQAWRPVKINVTGEKEPRIRARQGYFPQ
jgi:Ca-activated chloride channel family protein